VSHGYNLEAHAKAMRAYVKREGGVLVAEFVDPGYSAAKLNRPAYQEMMSRLDEFDLVLVYRFDRIHRNLRNSWAMLDAMVTAKVDFKSLSENLDVKSVWGRAIVSILQVFADLERSLTGERIKSARLERLGAEPGWEGKVPYGYKLVRVGDGWNLVIYEPEARIIRLMFRHLLSGFTTSEIARLLNERHIEAPAGGKWCEVKVRSQILPMRVTGTRGFCHDEVVVWENHPPIVSHEDYHAALMILVASSRRARPDVADISHTLLGRHVARYLHLREKFGGRKTARKRVTKPKRAAARAA
jgi:site-specific DNA recombinase